MTSTVGPLTAAFRAALGSRAGDAQGDLEPRLQAIVDEARAAFPEIANAGDLLARALAERIDPDEPVESALAALRGTDLWLACGCARGDPASLRVFDQRYLSKVPALIRRADADGQLAQEVAQELREKLLVPEAGRARIADYSGRGDLLGWLRIV